MAKVDYHSPECGRGDYLLSIKLVDLCITVCDAWPMQRHMVAFPAAADCLLAGTHFPSRQRWEAGFA